MLCTFILVTEASAASLTAEQTVALISGKTWSGVNAENNRFTFYHGPDGSFRARIASTAGVAKVYSGRYSRRGSEICWAWDNWKTLCSYEFEYSNERLTMIQTDQVVYVGDLAAGNPENL